MKTRLLVFVSALIVGLALSTPSFGQNREFHYYLRIPAGTYLHVSKPLKKQVVRTIPAGTVIKTKTTTIAPIAGKTVSETDTINPPITMGSQVQITTQKASTEDYVVTTTVRKKANIVQSKDTLYLNYQLFPRSDSSSKQVPRFKYFKWITKSASPRKKPWLPVAERTGEKLGTISSGPATGSAAFFDRKNTYFIKLNDRQTKHFSSRSVELAAITIPFQYRPGYTQDGKQAYGQFNVDFNLATYLGFKFGGITYRYRKLEPLTPNRITFSVGPFLSLTRVTLDSTNTRLATDRHNLYRSIASLSYGAAAVLDIYDFRVGVFGGNEFAIGSAQWDFDRRFWAGIGVGYKLTKLFGP